MGCDPRLELLARKRLDFNPRTPCGVRPSKTARMSAGLIISIHAPRVGCDGRNRILASHHVYFNPRTPCGVRRLGQELHADGLAISIHAPRVGCDRLEHGLIGNTLRNFNPRTPCGVRPLSSSNQTTSPGFQSTHPVWGATAVPGTCPCWPRNFNPRTPCGVRPGPQCRRLRRRRHFNPRTPCGVRHCLFQHWVCCPKISIHAPRVGCDATLRRNQAA